MRLGHKVAFLAPFAILSSLSGVLASPSSFSSGCRSAISNYNIYCGELGYYACRCLNPIFVSSNMKCLSDLVNNDTALVEQGMKNWITYCEEYGYIEVTFDELETIYEADVKANNFTKTSDLKNATAYLTTPIILSSEEVATSIHTVNTFSWNEYSGNLFG